MRMVEMEYTARKEDVGEDLVALHRPCDFQL